MKTKNLTPLNVAPVKRENVATVSTDGNAISQQSTAGPNDPIGLLYTPFAGDDAE